MTKNLFRYARPGTAILAGTLGGSGAPAGTASAARLHGAP
jgi:hypothetical protein